MGSTSIMSSSPGRHQGHPQPRNTLSEVEEGKFEERVVKASDFVGVREARMIRAIFCIVF